MDGAKYDRVDKNDQDDEGDRGDRREGINKAESNNEG
jgi:hypothetical protein